MKKYIPTQETIDIILKMYNDELLGSKSISQELNINQQIILRILKENGVQVGPSGRRFIGGKKVADKKYREKNKERLYNNHKEWYEENKDKWNEYIKEYREKNKDKVLQSRKKYYQAHKNAVLKRKIINSLLSFFVRFIHVQVIQSWIKLKKFSVKDLKT